MCLYKTALPAPIVICDFAGAWPFIARAQNRADISSGRARPDLRRCLCAGSAVLRCKHSQGVYMRRFKAFSFAHVGISLSAPNKNVLKRTNTKGIFQYVHSLALCFVCHYLPSRTQGLQDRSGHGCSAGLIGRTLRNSARRSGY